MSTRCSTCHRVEDPETPLTTLYETLPGQARGNAGIRLCHACLVCRESGWWPADTPEATGILQALGDRGTAVRGRYSYLVDEDHGVHLMRLRTDWLHRHAAPVSPELAPR